MDVVDYYQNDHVCEWSPSTGEFCWDSTIEGVVPVVTLSSTNQVSYQGVRISVGSTPVAVQAFDVRTSVDTSTVTELDGTITTTRTITQPTRALVVNASSNSVSVVDLVNHVILQNIGVGSQPADLVLGGGFAYVTNFGSGTISEINLTTLTQSRVADVGPTPTTLVPDPSGNAIWVGGQGYIKRIDTGSLSVLRVLSLSGVAASMAISQQQNEIVYGVVSNPVVLPGGQMTVGPNSSFRVEEVRLSDGALMGTYAVSSAAGYQATSPVNSISTNFTTGKGALVSTAYGGGAVVVCTDTGFVLISLVSHSQIMQGSTPSPVRGIAANPRQAIVYLAAPDSNSLISVPMPPAS